MKSSTLAACAAGAAIALAGFLVGSADAKRLPAFLAPPTAIGVVDMAAVFDRLEESAEWDVRIKALQSRTNDEAVQRRNELEALGREIEAMSDGPEKDAKIDAFRLKDLQNKQWLGFKELEVDREMSLKLQSVYRSIREGAKRLAEAEKYDLVVVDDSKLEIRTQRGQNAPPLTQQAEAQIERLRVLHAARTVDVTEKLIVQINNARALRPTAPAAPAR